MRSFGSVVFKACACLVDRRGRLLVFRHPGDRTLQLPKGTIEPDESPENAARRELSEESGVRFEGPIESLGLLERHREARIQHWHLFLMRSTAVMPERFEHTATGSPEEHGLVFAFEWLAPDAPIDEFALPYRQAIEKVRAAF